MLPELHREEVQAELRELYLVPREHHLFAFYGTGKVDELHTEFAGTVSIQPVSSELELRMCLPKLDDLASRIAFLVPWRGEVPMDLRGRFARNGAVRVIGRELRLQRLFKVDSIDQEVMSSPLVVHLLSANAPQSLSCRKPKLTVDEMWSTWLAEEWGSVVAEDFALDRLLVWAANDARGPAWRAKMVAADGQKVLTAVGRYLAQKSGEAAAVVLSAWLDGKGARALEYALVCQPLLSVELARVWIVMRLKQDLGVVGDELAIKVATQLAGAVPTAMHELARQARPLARALLERADQLVDVGEVRARLVDSPFLQSAWRERLDELGRALSSAAQAPSAARFAEVTRRFDRIEKHEDFKEDAMRPLVERAEMAVRLTAWLCSDQSDLDPCPTDTHYADVDRLARWYVTEGGFVDWARRVARGTAKGVFDQGVQTVVALADAKRSVLDLRFATALPLWLLAKRPATQVVPIEDVSKRVVAKFLDAQRDRSLLVLLLDGMAWAQAIEILLSLQDHPEQWGPIAWHGEKNALGDAAYPAVIAAFPTVTEISRSAFFAGKLMEPGKAHTTDKDPDRFRDNPNIAKFSEAGDWPRLLLRGEGHEAHGVASNEALSLVADKKRRVVGMVINAIDAALKGDPQQWHPWRYDNVRSLSAILSAARDAGRTVLLASDHGHVPCDRMQKSAGPITGGARYRPLATREEAVAACETKLYGQGVWTPKGATALALLTDDAHRYGGGAHAGEHGGATLAEVIAPCLFVRWDDPLGSQHDASLAVRTLTTPCWWYGELRDAVAAAPVPRPRKVAAIVASQQLGLPDVEPTTATPAALQASVPVTRLDSSRPGLPPAVVALGEVPGIKSLPRDRRDRLLKAVAFLLERNGLAKLEAFAGHLGLPGFRARGLVANELSPVLNVDGYQVLSCDETHVRLDRGMLSQQLEVDL